MTHKVADLRLRYTGSRGLVEAPLARLVDNAGRRFAPHSLVWKSGPRENAQWLARRRLSARTVTIKVRYADFRTVTRSHTLSQQTSDPDLIASWAVELLARTEAGTRPVRLLGVRVAGLVEESPG